MTLKLLAPLLAAATLVFPTLAEDAAPAVKPSAPPDKEKLSYAYGMDLGLQIKNAGIDADPDVIARALNDVLAGKHTEIREPEIGPVLKQAEAFGRLKEATQNINDGEGFLAKNARAEGITVLPDGLQYRVLKTGAGDFPKPIELLSLKFRATWINGKEFQHNDSLEIPFLACPKGLQEALKLMKIGSHWQIYEPYTLAFGRMKDRAVGYGSVLIYDLELLSSEREGARPNQHRGPGGRVGHSLDEELLPPLYRSTLNSSP